MSDGKRRLLFLGAGLVVAVGLFVGLSLAGGPGASVAPSFALASLEGPGQVKLPVVERGTPVPAVVVFFASWCTPCQSELPVVARTAAALKMAGTRVAFIGIDGNDTLADGRSFVRQSGVTFPVGWDSTSAVAPRYGLDGYPDTVFVDAAGDVVHTVRGPVTAAVLQEWAQRIALPG